MARIVYANTITYDFDLQQRPHHIMNELADRGHEIFWIDNNPNKGQFKKKIKENLTVVYDWEKFCKIYKNDIDIYFASWSARWVDIEKLNPNFVIYDSLDLFPENEKEEKKMVDCADSILTTASGLYNYHKKHTDKPINMCENGCFEKHRDREYKLPKELKTFKDQNEPIIFFSGALSLNPTNGWVDINILREITKKYYIVVVGKTWGVDEVFYKKNIDVFNKMINLGTKEYEELQTYYNHCTVNILPFKRCQVADYSFPLKTIEGCNHGKICVSSDIPVSVELNKENPNAVLISKTPKEFVKNIDIAVKNSNNAEYIQQCYNVADGHTWKQKVDIIEKIIKENI